MWISHISNPYQIQVPHEKVAPDMVWEYHESVPHIGHEKDGIIRQLSDIISSELKSEENRYNMVHI